MPDEAKLTLNTSEPAQPAFVARKEALPELAQSLLSAKSAARTIKGAMEALAPLASSWTQSELMSISEEAADLERRIGSIYNDIAKAAFS